MSHCAQNKVAHMLPKTDTTGVVRECGFVTTADEIELADTKHLSSDITSSMQRIASLSVAPITEKSTASTGPLSLPGCVKNITDPAHLGLGMRPRNSWPTYEPFVMYGLHKNKLYYHVGIRTPVIHSSYYADEDVSL